MESRDPKSSMSSELEQLENELVRLISRRTKLLGNISRKRRERKESLTDPQLEKNLWKKWKTTAQSGNKRIYRQLFNQLNNLAYSHAEKPQEKPFCLYPSQRSLNISIPGPKESLETRLYTMIATCTPGIRTITDYPLNDIHVEFIKALNQCKAKLSWEEDTLHSQEAGLDMDGVSVYVGSDEFNLFLMLALGVGRSCVVRFNCSASLKNRNLNFLQPVLQEMGARLNFIEPKTYTLPAKLEASGIFPEHITFPADGDPMFLLALIMAASTYSKPLQIRFPEDMLPAQAVNCLDIMENCGVSLERSAQSIKIDPSSPVLPRSPEIQLDPILSGYLLAMPLFCKGTVHLTGSWAQCPLSAAVLDLLHHSGLKTEIGEKEIKSTPGTPPQEKVLDIREFPRLLPLATALVAGIKQEGSIFVDTAEADVTTAGECLETLGISCKVYPNRLELAPANTAPQKDPPWECPTPLWGLSYALISFTYRGLCLANPGILTSIWPRFWKIFMSLPEPQKQMQTPSNEGEKTQRRRIIVR